jgi:hypothetical protein
LYDSELDMVTNFTNHEEAIFDETYEFGECEKCAESENDSIIENETEEHENFEKGNLNIFFQLDRYLIIYFKN